MAPFNTHFLIAEKIWPDLPGPWQPHFGQFCFGCVAPDVDKISPVLTQKQTHFFDRTDPDGLMVTHRSATFIKDQAEFLRAPFADLAPAEQAYGLGYLCHLCVDEVTKALWTAESLQSFFKMGISPIAALSALDDIIRPRFQDYQAICRGLGAITPLVATTPNIPAADLSKMHELVCRFAQAETGDDELVVIVEVMFSASQDEFEQRLSRFRRERGLITTEIDNLQIDRLVKIGLAHSCSRLADLITSRTPQPGPPDLSC